MTRSQGRVADWIRYSRYSLRVSGRVRGSGTTAPEDGAARLTCGEADLRCEGRRPCAPAAPSHFYMCSTFNRTETLVSLPGELVIVAVTGLERVLVCAYGAVCGHG